MARTRNLVKVEDIDLEHEQVNPDTWMRVYPYDGCGAYSPDGTMRMITWVDADTTDEYPYQTSKWYPLGTLIPLSD